MASDKATYIIAGTTALRYWLHAESRRPRSLSGNPVGKSRFNPNDILSKAVIPPAQAISDLRVFGEPPYTVLVSKASRCHVAENCFPMVCTRRLITGSLIHCDRAVYVVSPEIALSQIASRFSIGELVEIGTNLCADYYLGMDASFLHRRPCPITTPLRIQTMLARSELNGAARALRASAFIHAQSASPMETKVATLLGLPMRYGGYGFSGFEMNYRIDLGKAANTSGRTFCKIDLAFPKSKVGIEYDGLDYHCNIIADRKRYNTLETLGWKLIAIDKQQLFDAKAFDAVASQIARMIKRRIRKPDSWDSSSYVLRNQLLAPKR